MKQLKTYSSAVKKDKRNCILNTNFIHLKFSWSSCFYFKTNLCTIFVLYKIKYELDRKLFALFSFPKVYGLFASTLRKTNSEESDCFPNIIFKDNFTFPAIPIVNKINFAMVYVTFDKTLRSRSTVF